MKIKTLFAAIAVSVALSGCCFTGNCPGEVAAAPDGDLMALDDSALRAEEAAARARAAAEEAEALFHRELEK
jgi:hypothetical protein